MNNFLPSIGRWSKKQNFANEGAFRIRFNMQMKANMHSVVFTPQGKTSFCINPSHATFPFSQEGWGALGSCRHGSRMKAKSNRCRR